MKALDAMGKLDVIRSSATFRRTRRSSWCSTLSQDEDVRGPWNEEPDFEYVADPQPEGGLPLPPVNADDEGHDSRSSRPRKKRAGAATAPAA